MAILTYPLSKTMAGRKYAVVILFLIGAALSSPAAESPPVPDIASLATRNPRTTAMIEFRRREAGERKRRFKPYQTWTPFGRISPHLKDAVLAAEDDRFFHHDGVEWALTKQALIEDLKTGRKKRGASTITQQVAKNLYLSPTKSYYRKMREILLALEMERKTSKRRILEIYLNIAEWGDGIFGAEAAARTYFTKSAADLTLDEAVALAAVLPSPRKHSPLDGTRWVLRRKAWVWRQLRVTGRLAPPPEIAPAPAHDNLPGTNPPPIAPLPLPAPGEEGIPAPDQ